MKLNSSWNHENGGENLNISCNYLICMNALVTGRQTSNKLKHNLLLIRFMFGNQMHVTYHGPK